MCYVLCICFVLYEMQRVVYRIIVWLGSIQLLFPYTVFQIIRHKVPRNVRSILYLDNEQTLSNNLLVLYMFIHI